MIIQIQDGQPVIQNPISKLLLSQIKNSQQQPVYDFRDNRHEESEDFKTD
ncbi:MAG: hypothetical protein PUP93_18405 [Rhizonema sp. NSF051]|nr:hypothetical protein [Rhizonema sp. NSF051]